MAKFDKSKFIKDRVMANAEIIGGFLKEDSTGLAQGALSKLETLYEDILKDATTEEEAKEALEKSSRKNGYHIWWSWYFNRHYKCKLMVKNYLKFKNNLKKQKGLTMANYGYLRLLA